MSTNYCQLGFQRLLYLECNKGQPHVGEFLNQLCMDPDCEFSGLICSQCEQESHIKHQVVPLKLFLQDMNKIQGKFQSNSDFLFLIEQCQQSSLQTIKTYQQKFQEILNQSLAKVQFFYEQLKAQVNQLQEGDITNTLVIEKIYQGKYDNQQQLINDLKNVISQVQYDDKQEMHFVNNIQTQTFIDLVQEKQNKVKNILNEINTQFIEKTVQIDSIFKEMTLKQSGFQKFKFSPSMKGQGIVVTDEINAKQTGYESSGQRFVLTEPTLQKYKKTVWGMKVTKFKGWVGVGICHKQLLIDFKYNFNYTTLGHGSYLISTNGYSWSHLKAEFNTAFKSFQFTENDTVYMEYDPFTHKLRFNKNESKAPADRFELLIDDKGDELCPCANICSQDDSVQIINSPPYKFD